MQLNPTHDPARKSWVTAANDPGSDFPVQNLPHGVFRRRGGDWRGGVAIGDHVLDLAAAVGLGVFSAGLREIAEAASAPTLNRFMAMGPGAAGKLRARLSGWLAAGGEGSDAIRERASLLLAPMSDVELTTPCAIRAFTDFMTSTYHIKTARPGRPEGPLQPCFRHLPIGYNSRASSITADGRGVERPNGQRREGAEVIFGPTARMDFELELACFVGAGNQLGRPVPLARAEQHMFGLCLVNDWSARDMQTWESVLGPFLAKSFRTSISPWVVTLEALAPFRAPGFSRSGDDPVLMPYLDDAADRAGGGFDIALDALIRTRRMRAEQQAPVRLTETHFRHAYFTLAQMLTHHASNGCNLEPGDLLSSGTVSGPAPESAACIWELTGGLEPLSFANGESRLWLEDGDEVIFRGRAERDGFVGIGFGECRGELLPAVAWPSD